MNALLLILLAIQGLRSEPMLELTSALIPKEMQLSIIDHTCKFPTGCGVADAYYQTPKWMGLLPDETKLADMSIPGTHDSMALYSKAGLDAQLVICQSMSLRTQLDRGIRAFDIRNRPNGEWFTIHHGAVFQHAYFGQDVAQVMTDFLRENPSETIIMSHQQEHTPAEGSDSYSTIMRRYMDSYPALTELTSTSASSLTLGAARGKILINYISKMRSLGRRTQQNQWEITSCDKREAKGTRINELLNEAISHPDNQRLYVNYLSGNGAGISFVPWLCGHDDEWAPLTIAALAKRYNKLATGILESRSNNPVRVGILFADFPGSTLIAAIIKMNNFKCRKNEAQLNSKSIVTSCKGNTVKSGDTIALRSKCGNHGWISNYCTINCGKKTEPSTCAGSDFTKDKISKCKGATLIIVAEGRALGDVIYAGDNIGLYYGSGYWMSCKDTGDQCTTRSCPGAVSRMHTSEWKWDNGCQWEKFQIQHAKKAEVAPIHPGDEVAIRRISESCDDRFISVDGNKITLRTCPGCKTTPDNKTWGKYVDCLCETFDLVSFGRHFKNG